MKRHLIVFSVLVPLLVGGVTRGKEQQTNMMQSANECQAVKAPVSISGPTATVRPFWLEWQSVTQSERYELQRWSNSSDWTTLYSGRSLFFQESDINLLRQDKQFRYRVRACDERICSSYTESNWIRWRDPSTYPRPSHLEEVNTLDKESIYLSPLPGTLQESRPGGDDDDECRGEHTICKTQPYCGVEAQEISTAALLNQNDHLQIEIELDWLEPNTLQYYEIELIEQLNLKNRQNTHILDQRRDSLYRLGFESQESTIINIPYELPQEEGELILKMKVCYLISGECSRFRIGNSIHLIHGQALAARTILYNRP